MAVDDHLDDVARSVSDGSPVDWSGTESGSEAETQSLRALRDVARIAAFNRELQLTPPDDPALALPIPRGELQRWGDLTLLEPIGAGSRGEVWRAWDPTLQREVALKFLQPREGGIVGGDGQTALLNEARALARVRHPAVVTVHGIAEHEGRVGMWMDYLRGPTLAAEIERRGAMPADEVMRIGLDLCSALKAVHHADLVHRDLKPANIVLEPDGRTVLTDFGLGWRPALAGEETPSSSGTPIFMPPEVLAGQPATSQSDLYALGVTLWWALAGRPPFHARTLEELKAQASKGPSTPLQVQRPDAPRGLVHAIERAMDPASETRATSAANLTALLQRAQVEMRPAAPRRRWSKAATAVVAVAVGVLALGILFGRNALDRVVPGGFGRSPQIAVLPLANLSNDPAEEYFADGMTEELIARLAQVGDLRVISRSSVMPFKNTKEPLREVARKLGVKMVVEGSVTRFQDRIRVSTQLVDAGSGRAVWAEVYERDARDVFAIQSDVAKAVVRLVKARITPRERDRMQRTQEVNPRAHAAYLQGVAASRLLNVEGTRRAISLFQKAIAIDPRYADPWTGLAYAYDYSIVLSMVPREEGREKTMAAARRALELDPGSAPARGILTSNRFYSDWDFAAAERGYREVLALSPGDANTRIELAVLLVAMGRFDEAISESNRAREVDPLSSIAATVSLFPLFEGRRYSDAIQAAKDVLTTHPSPHVMAILGQAMLFSGKQDEAIETLRKSQAMDPSSPPVVGWLGFAYGVAGRPAEAKSMLDSLAEMEKTQDVDPYYFGLVHVGLGEKDRALDYLEKAVTLHSGAAFFIRVDPALDPLRQDPRFKVLLKRFGAVKTG